MATEDTAPEASRGSPFGRKGGRRKVESVWDEGNGDALAEEDAGELAAYGFDTPGDGGDAAVSRPEAEAGEGASPEPEVRPMTREDVEAIERELPAEVLRILKEDYRGEWRDMRKGD